eukprot:jgi/Mesvir1/5940/Mv00705-RA.1
MFIYPKQSPVVDAALERLSKIVMLPTANMEAMQVLRYGVGQSYRSHEDTFPVHMLDSAGQRTVTALGFLNTPEEGGETIFSRVPPAPHQKGPEWSECGQKGLGVKPKKGNILIFHDLLPDGRTDLNSTHYACPVIKGEKWSAPIWVHTNNFQTRHKLRRGPPCQDQDGGCEGWAKSGECVNNPSFMVGVDDPGSCVTSCLNADPNSVPLDVKMKC